jgi:hypothetical protein
MTLLILLQISIEDQHEFFARGPGLLVDCTSRLHYCRRISLGGTQLCVSIRMTIAAQPSLVTRAAFNELVNVAQASHVIIDECSKFGAADQADSSTPSEFLSLQKSEIDPNVRLCVISKLCIGTR